MRTPLVLPNVELEAAIDSAIIWHSNTEAANLAIITGRTTKEEDLLQILNHSSYRMVADGAVAIDYFIQFKVIKNLN